MYGLKDEVNCTSKLIDTMDSHSEDNLLTKLLWFVFTNTVDYLIGNIFGHSILLVFQKK